MRRAQPTSSTPVSASGASSTTSQGNPSLAQTRRGVKRPVPRPVFNGASSSFKKTMNEYHCPLCFQILQEATITRCGHTFCSGCLRVSLNQKAECPKCGNPENSENLIPNLLANELVTNYQSSSATVAQIPENARLNDDVVEYAKLFDNVNINKLNLNGIEALMTILNKKREVLTAESIEHQRTLLQEFLSQLLRLKKAEKEQIDRQVIIIERDLSHIETMPLVKIENERSSSSLDNSIAIPPVDGFNTQVLSSVELREGSMSSKKKRMHSHFEELVRIYMDVRNPDLADLRNNDATVPMDRSDVDYAPLEEFGVTLSKISRYSRLKPLATLSYSADLLTNSNIVSSIEFDKDNEFFAIAGVTRKIKLFEYATVIGSSVDIQCPTAELQCNAKISCVAWSNYYKNRLASSDYDGCVTLWDTSTAAKTRTLNEHEKRVWTVDWSNGDPRLLASGSDDSKVKLWTSNADRSVGSIEAKANVCCVKFSPTESFLIAFGCADHCIHYYDFRHPKEPIAILTGHKKAVSYVKFASKEELVSASTDSHLRLWQLQDSFECVRSYTGHINEKNFVGLATDGDYIACGSENNSMYVYYRHLPKPLLSFKFDNHRNMLDSPKYDDAGEFVSAVAWKRGSPVVVAANSQGSIKILELT